MDRKNVKFSKTGEYYAKENWDKFIHVIGFENGKAICKGWKITHEQIHTDENGNEYFKIENLTFPAYCRI